MEAGSRNVPGPRGDPSPSTKGQRSAEQFEQGHFEALLAAGHHRGGQQMPEGLAQDVLARALVQFGVQAGRLKANSTTRLSRKGVRTSSAWAMLVRSTLCSMSLGRVESTSASSTPFMPGIRRSAR
jgi:hypothetical protein